MSGMAQATGVQALARAAELLDQPRYLKTARRALGAFETRPPVGVRTAGPGGGRALPPVLVRPAAVDLQRLPPVADRALRLRQAGRTTARATKLYEEAEPEARKELPLSDVGDWSRYSYGGARVVARAITSCCASSSRACASRSSASCTAVRRALPRLQSDPPKLDYTGPRAATEDELVSHPLQALEALGGRDEGLRGRQVVVLADRHLPARSGCVRVAPARSPGCSRCELAAKELRTGLGMKDRDRAEIEVANAPG